MPLEPTIFGSTSGFTAAGLLYRSTVYDALVKLQASTPVGPNAAVFKAALLAYAVTPGAVYLASLMRFMDSNTLVTSAALGSSVVSCPVLTRPLLSAELSTTVGCAAAMTMVGGAIELPPDTELFEPIKLSRPPRAPNW